jgi:hypothetical protein
MFILPNCSNLIAFASILVYEADITPPYMDSCLQVTSTFKQLFPSDFDRAVPVINHKAVDLLLMQLDLVMWRYEIVSARRHDILF